jgi:hypothetical protein
MLHLHQRFLVFINLYPFTAVKTVYLHYLASTEIAINIDFIELLQKLQRRAYFRVRDCGKKVLEYFV